MKSKHSVTQIIRHIVQLISFVVFPGLFIFTYSALKNIVTALLAGSFSLSASGSDLAVLIAVIPITAVFGRFFCGFICSFGAMGELLYFLSGLIMKKRPKIGARADRVLKYVKYAVLLLLIVFVWIIGFKLNTAYDPWHVFGVYTSVSGFTSAKALISIGGLLLLVIMAASFFFERFFCRYLCPLGAVFTLISRFRIFKVKKKQDKCSKCGLCDRKCPMGISVAAADDKILSGECIDCMKCIDACPTNVLYTNASPAIVGTAAAVAITGLYYAGNVVAGLPQSPDNNLVSESQDAVQKGLYRDGIYKGSADGYRGTTKVEVTVENGFITDITVVSYNDDAQFFNKAKNTVITEIILSQSTDVSTVSGATFSSKGIIDAVSNALSGSLLSSDSCDNTDTSSEKSDSTSDISSDSAGTLDLADGTYTGIGKGYRGDVNVSVVVKNGTITDITVISYQDDAQFFERAKDTVIGEIILSQSTDVATVSGATFSSKGIIDAVSNALSGSLPSSDSSDNTDTSSEKSDSSSAVSSDAAGTLDLADGTYTGVGTGYRGDVNVSVVVENGTITDITVISYQDDAQFFERAKDTVIGEIISAQSTDVATVSGATFSSKGIIDAVSNALSGSLLSSDSSDNTDTSSEKSDSTSDISSDSAGTLDLADGTYTGVGTGYRGDVNVSVIVENGKITDITVISYQDDAQFFERAKDTVIGEIISAQSTDVATVSGATFSSNGIIDAVSKAIGSSFENPNSSSNQDGGGHGHGHRNR